jgi:hypothetical protein
MELTHISGKLLAAGLGDSGNLNNCVVKIRRRLLAYLDDFRALFFNSAHTRFCFVFNMVPAAGFKPATP